MDEHRHYLLTPRDLTAWVRGLLRYELNSEQVLDCVAYEVRNAIGRGCTHHVISICRMTRPSMPPNILSIVAQTDVSCCFLRFVRESAPFSRLFHSSALSHLMFSQWFFSVPCSFTTACLMFTVVGMNGKEPRLFRHSSAHPRAFQSHCLNAGVCVRRLRTITIDADISGSGSNAGKLSR